MLSHDDRQEVEGLISRHNADLMQRLQDWNRHDLNLSDFVRNAVQRTQHGEPCGASDIASAVLITIFIPSHSRLGPIGSDTQNDWRKAAMALLGKHFKGATCLGGLHEGLWAEPGEEDSDFPVIVQAYAAHDELMSDAAIKDLKDFMHLMAEEMLQDSTLLVVGGLRLLFDKDGGKRKAYYDHLKTVVGLERDGWITGGVATAFKSAEERRGEWGKKA